MEANKKARKNLKDILKTDPTSSLQRQNQAVITQENMNLKTETTYAKLDRLIQRLNKRLCNENRILRSALSTISLNHNNLDSNFYN